jgi:tetratricopeptide (TPR) repeat protein
MIQQRRVTFAAIAFALCVFATPPHAAAQWLSDPALESEVQAGIQDVYNLSFDSARAKFNDVAQTKPNDPTGPFFIAMVDWWNIAIHIDDESLDRPFLTKLNHVIAMCDERLDKNGDDVEALFFKGGALGFKGRLYANRGDWVKSANAGHDALPLVQKAYKLAPDNADILLGIGIYNYYAAVIPEQFPFVKPVMIFFPSGDKAKGIEQLKTASEKATYARIESAYFLLQVYQNYEKRYADAQPLAAGLHQRFPDNVIFHKFLGRAYAGLGYYPELDSTFTSILNLCRAHRFGYDSAAEREAEYYLGISKMMVHRYDAALTHFYRTDELSRTLDSKEQSGFMAMANLKIGMIYDLQKKRDLAIIEYNKVLKLDDYQNSQQLAGDYIKTPYKE